MSEVFDDIYRRNAWGGRESRSGQGAGDHERAVLGPQIVELVKELGVTSVLDVGCGETYWTPELPDYTGIDVSLEAISVALKNHPLWDIRLESGEPYPRKDLVLCRCVIQHLSNASALALLERIRASGATWLLTTSYIGNDNGDIRDGGHHRPNLELPPFSFPEPIRDIPDESAAGCYLGLWRL